MRRIININYLFLALVFVLGAPSFAANPVDWDFVIVTSGEDVAHEPDSPVIDNVYLTYGYLFQVTKVEAQLAISSNWVDVTDVVGFEAVEDTCAEGLPATLIDDQVEMDYAEWHLLTVVESDGTLSITATEIVLGKILGQQIESVRITGHIEMEGILRPYLSTSVASGLGSVLPESGYYDFGSSVVLAASPTEDWGVAAWSGTDDDAGTSIYNQVTMNANRAVTVSFGQKPAAPSGPSPANLASGVALDATLSWGAVSGADHYDVYFGRNATFASGDRVGTLAGTSLVPGDLLNEKTYYWRVDAVNEYGVTTGDLWRFSTVEAEPYNGVDDWALYR